MLETAGILEVFMKKTIIILVVIMGLLLSLPFVIYLKMLPYAVSNQNVINYVQDYVQESAGLDLKITNPVLKTEMSPVVAFKLENLSLKKGKDSLFEIKNVDTVISLAKVFDKSVVLKKLGADYLFADANKLMALGGAPQGEPQKIDWVLEWFDSVLYIKKCLILYNVDSSTAVKVTGSDMEITDSRNPKFVRFNVEIDVKKNKETLKLTIDDKNKVFIKDKKLFIDNSVLSVNGSNVFVSATADQKNNFNLTVFSKKFDVKNVVELLESNLLVPNGDEMLIFFKNIKGDFDFDVNLTNKGMNGVVLLNRLSLNIEPLNNLPICLQKGRVNINDKEIVLSDFEGYYGTQKSNIAKANGTIKDYYKSVDTNIVVTGVTTNEFTKNYLSKAIGYPLELVGEAGTKMIIKSKYNKIDLSMMFKLAKGEDLLVDGASLSPVGYDRAVKADLFIDGVKLNIKSINYYIASVIDKNSKLKPILSIKGNADIAKGTVQDLGFEIPKPLPSEFLNVLIGQKLFKKGTIAGHMQVVYKNNVPVLSGNLSMKKVRIPSQRLSIKDAEISTDKNLIHINAFGKFKRSDYKLSGNIVNEIVFPIIVKNINLTVDSIDIEKLMNSFNAQNTAATAALPIASAEVGANASVGVPSSLVSASADEENGNEEAFVFDTGLLIVEECVLNLVKGVYKEITFGNLKATLTLDKNGILQVLSNRFDFAQGISSCKVHCDLKNHKYSVRLGVKDIDSDLIATTLLGLKKEISGKASGLIELNTDDSMKMNGSMKFAVKDGTIGKIGLVEYVLKFASLFRNPMAMISPSTILDLVNIPEGKFKKINGDIVIKDNVIEKLMIKSSSPQLSSFIIGRLDLENRDSSLRIYTKFSSKHKGFAGALRSLSLNSLATKTSVNSRNDSNYYAAELKELPSLEIGEDEAQVFLTKVDGDIEKFNFMSSLKKIK